MPSAKSKRAALRAIHTSKRCSGSVNRLVKHYDKTYPGEHEAIITQDVWDRTQKFLRAHCVHEGRRHRPMRLEPFRGIVRCGYCGGAFKPSFTTKEKHKIYRYLICDVDSKRVRHTCPIRSIPLNELEEIVLKDIKVVLSKPEVFFGILLEAKNVDENGGNLTEADVGKAFTDLKEVWKVMFPVERYKFIQTVIKKITVFRDQIKIEYNKEALSGLVKG